MERFEDETVFDTICPTCLNVSNGRSLQVAIETYIENGENDAGSRISFWRKTVVTGVIVECIDRSHERAIVAIHGGAEEDETAAEIQMQVTLSARIGLVCLDNRGELRVIDLKLLLRHNLRVGDAIVNFIVSWRVNLLTHDKCSQERGSRE